MAPTYFIVDVEVPLVCLLEVVEPGVVVGVDLALFDLARTPHVRHLVRTRIQSCELTVREDIKVSDYREKWKDWDRVLEITCSVLIVTVSHGTFPGPFRHFVWSIFHSVQPI